MSDLLPAAFASLSKVPSSSVTSVDYLNDELKIVYSQDTEIIVTEEMFSCLGDDISQAKQFLVCYLKLLFSNHYYYCVDKPLNSYIKEAVESRFYRELNTLLETNYVVCGLPTLCYGAYDDTFYEYLACTPYPLPKQQFVLYNDAPNKIFRTALIDKKQDGRYRTFCKYLFAEIAKTIYALHNKSVAYQLFEVYVYISSAEVRILKIKSSADSFVDMKFIKKTDIEKVKQALENYLFNLSAMCNPAIAYLSKSSLGSAPVYGMGSKWNTLRTSFKEPNVALTSFAKGNLPDVEAPRFTCFRYLVDHNDSGLLSSVKRAQNILATLTKVRSNVN